MTDRNGEVLMRTHSSQRYLEDLEDFKDPMVAAARKSKCPIPGKPEGKSKKKHAKAATLQGAALSVDPLVTTDGDNAVAGAIVISPLMAGTSYIIPTPTPCVLTLTNADGGDNAPPSAFNPFVATADGIGTSLTLIPLALVPQLLDDHNSMYTDPYVLDALCAHTTSGSTFFDSSLFPPPPTHNYNVVGTSQTRQHPSSSSSSASTPSSLQPYGHGYQEQTYTYQGAQFAEPSRSTSFSTQFANSSGPMSFGTQIAGPSRSTSFESMHLDPNTYSSSLQNFDMDCFSAAPDTGLNSQGAISNFHS